MKKWVNYYSRYYASQNSAGILATSNRSEWVKVWFYYWSWIKKLTVIWMHCQLFQHAWKFWEVKAIPRFHNMLHPDTWPPIPKPGTMNSTAKRHTRTCAWSLSLVQPEHLSWEGCRIPYVLLPVNFQFQDILLMPYSASSGPHALLNCAWLITHKWSSIGTFRKHCTGVNKMK